MRGLCGWFSASPRRGGSEALERMLGASSSADVGCDRMAVTDAGMAVFGRVARPKLAHADGSMLAVAGHPRLSTAPHRAADPLEMLGLFRRSGRDALAGLSGDFALAVWDADRRCGLIAVDRIGVHQLTYAQAGDAFVFGSTLDLVAAYPGMRRELRAQGLYDYLYFHVCPGPETVYAGMLRVPAGHCIRFAPGDRARPQAYWSMRFEEDGDAPLEDLSRDFRAEMRTAVEDAAKVAVSGGRTGVFLSGGTDSSTVAGMLAQVSDGPVPAFSIGFGVEGYDEMAFARIAAKHFACEHHEYYVQPADVVDAVPRIAALYDQPFGNASAVPTYYCAGLARRHGVTTLLAGDGGDELFGGNERYVKHHLLSLYGRLPSLLRRGMVEPLLLSAPSARRIPGLRKLRSYVEQARPSMPDRYASYNLLTYLGSSTVLTPEFLASVDPERPRAVLVDAHAPYSDASLVNQLMGIDLRLILADGDLPKVTRMCELAGVDVAFPMLDERIIDFSRRLGARLKLRGTELRWFFKHALRDFLPREVIDKRKHGFGLPVGAWLTNHAPLREIACDSIALLRQRGIVRPDFIDDLLSVRMREHPAYFGTMAWILMMLAIWLDSRKL